jgi:hypothetical protein
MAKKQPAEKPPNNVVELRPPRAERLASEAKWGRQVMSIGFCILPALLFRAQRRLGLSGMQLALITQIAEFWWQGGKFPFPKKDTLAQRMGISDKQVQRIARQLEQRGYLARETRMTAHGQTSNTYNLSGLVKKLKELAPEFISVAEQKRNVEKRGGLKAKQA